MVENITNVTSAPNGFIHTMLHSQEFWIALIVAGVSLACTIMYKWFFVWRLQRLKSLKKVFDDVEIINNGDMCKYPPNPNWLKYPQAIRYLKIHRVWGSWKKIGEAKNYYDDEYKGAKRDLAQILARDVWSKVSFGIVSWDGRGDMPSNWYLDEHWGGEDKEYDIRDAIIKEYLPYDVNQSNGKFILRVFTTTYIAGTDTESKRAELRNLIQSVMDADKTKKLVKKVKDAKNDVEKADDVFKEKLTKIIRKLNFKAEGLK